TGFAKRQRGGISHLLAQIDTVPAEDRVEIEPINDAKRIEPVNRWQGASVFDIGQTAQADQELLVVAIPCDLVTGLLHIAVAQTQVFADPPQMSPRIFGVAHAANKTCNDELEPGLFHFQNKRAEYSITRAS